MYYSGVLKRIVKSPNMYFFETYVIIEQNQTLYPIEIKKSAQSKPNSIRHLKVLEKTGRQIDLGAVICLCSNIIPIDRNNNFVPVSMI
ncbi:MAG: hypothetical protein IBX70_05355 [Clostridia bacterium]|nr:hypothetical protein [Clostridia bacterium]